MKIGIASDHRGFDKKELLLSELKKKYDVIDYGNLIYDEKDDYPKYAIKVSEAVKEKDLDYGVLLCGSGIGVSIAANKVEGIRCAKVDSQNDAYVSKYDNDANVIALDADKSLAELLLFIETFITTPFSNLERHKNRINQIKEYENKND